uniref:Uncharacterized protein n=1 Tax=Desertifilum tharense IPPAS B-1220 TaxID=1781255 RepID=A0A1E5QG83_9CYAN|nr:hypothetical protein BH720_18820 [Desertifilum tharense IPPAS B-1220]
MAGNCIVFTSKLIDWRSLFVDFYSQSSESFFPASRKACLEIRIVAESGQIKLIVEISDINEID